MWSAPKFITDKRKRKESMPLTEKGRKIKTAMQSSYGFKKGEQVFYASQNKGTITETHKKKKKVLPKPSCK